MGSSERWSKRFQDIAERDKALIDAFAHEQPQLLQGDPTQLKRLTAFPTIRTFTNASPVVSLEVQTVVGDTRAGFSNAPTVVVEQA